jgi:L-ascorbate metabolism protein UlaG (beta-lactamase superfamily)
MPGQKGRDMQITWLGHSAFRIAMGGQILLIDPWLDGNPAFPAVAEPAALDGVTAIFLTHAHGDHASDAPRVARLSGAPVFAGHELAEYLAAETGTDARGFACGGTITLGAVAVTMVPARHSSSIEWTGPPTAHGGDPAGFMIAGEGRCIYVSGDTGIMADMAWMADYHRPDIGILCIGGHYTMDIAQAAWAARRFFDFKVVIPCHDGTFGVLAQDAIPLRAALPGVAVRIPGVIEPVVL